MNKNIVAIVGIFGMIIWGTCGYLFGTYFEKKRWEKATAEVVWHCIHTGPSRPLNSNPGSNEKASIMPTEEDKRAGEHPCDNATIFWYDPQTGEHFKTCEESIPYR
jgi:hypothetical protein